jgi:hypothetical protein
VPGACLLLLLLAQQPTPLTIGETFTIPSRVLNETRTVNVYRPSPYGLAADAALPVLYMPDGGIQEDFLHVAGLVQVLSGNGTMRPFLVVGIENTERRRDMTGPTGIDADRKIAPRVGGSAAFRAFIRDELMPAIGARYRTTGETAIVGESLAGLFVVETLLVEPALFDTYIAFDPSLWWNDGTLVDGAAGSVGAPAMKRKTLYMATSADGDRGDAAKRFARVLETHAALAWTHEAMAAETHATIYHPAALRAFRLLFKPGARE